MSAVLPRPRLALADLAEHAAAGIFARPLRALLTALGTVLGIGSLVVTLGVARTAGAQITDRFDALAATEVSVEPAPSAGGGAGGGGAGGSGGGSGGARQAVLPWDAADRLGPLNGVVTAAGFGDANTGDARASATPRRDVTRRNDLTLRVLGANATLADAARLEVVAGRFFDTGHEQRADRVAVLGEQAARRLGITSLALRPAVFVGDEAYSVIGIIAASARHAGFADAVLLPSRTAEDRYGLRAPSEVLVRTEPGAAALIASQAALALRPNEPGVLQVTAPPEPRATRQAVANDVNGVFVVLGLVALVVGAVGIMNVTLVTVMERTGEIGLRRALGARHHHIAAQFLAESTALGLAGGITGASAGVAAIVAISAAKDWTPVLELSLVALAPLGGALTGLVAGLYPAWRAASLEPVEALRSGL